MRAVQVYSGADVLSPAYAIPKVFPFQSYYDSTLLQGALLPQRLGSLIVDSTLEQLDVAGFAVGLHPSSQTPVAVQFKTGTNTERSGVHVLKPGQIIRPTGGSSSHAFKGFSWGLPYGWLGGGQATLIVFRTADADALWPGNSEVIFHRARFEVLQPADLDAGDVNNAPNNWPMRFPWTNAFASVSGSSVPQYGTPNIAIAEPTRVAVALRGEVASSLAAAVPVRMILQATEDFGIDSADEPILTTPVFFDFYFDAFTSVGVSGNLATQNRVQIITNEPIVRFAADRGGVVFVDMSGAETLAGTYIDVCRYGKL